MSLYIKYGKILVFVHKIDTFIYKINNNNKN